MSLLTAFRSILDRDRAPAPAPLSSPPRRPANLIGKGFVDSRQRHDGGVRRIVVTAEDATFRSVRAFALRHDSSFAEATRRLIATGLCAHDDEGPQP